MYRPVKSNSTVEEITERTFGLHRHAVKCNLALPQWQYMINFAINSLYFSPVHPDTKLSETDSSDLTAVAVFFIQIPCALQHSN